MATAAVPGVAKTTMSSRDDASDDGLDDAFEQLLNEYQRAVENDQLSEAEAIAMQAILWASENADALDDQERDRLQIAASYEESRDWRGLEEHYRRSIDRAADQPLELWKAHSDLSRLFHLIGHREAELEHERLAVQAARRFETTDTVLIIALQGLTAAALSCGLVSEARSAVEEALGVLPREKMYDLILAQCLVLRAACACDDGDVDAAECDLNEAERRLERQTEMDFAAGVHACVARWWSVRAKICAQRGHAAKSTSAWRRAVASRRHVAGLPHTATAYAQNALALALWDQAEAAQAANLVDEAQTAAAESRALREQLGLAPFA
jgi:hypothetical protein